MSAGHNSPEAACPPSSDAPSGWRASTILGARLTVLMCTCIGGGLFWFLLRATYPLFEVPRDLSTPVMFPTPEFVAAHRAASARVDRQHAILYLGLYGALVSAALGVGEAVARRSLRAALVSMTAGGVMGAASGIAAGLAAQLTLEALKPCPAVAPATRAVVVQIVLLGIAGGGIGMAFGAVGRGARCAFRCAAHGALGGAVAGILFPLLVVTALPAGPLDGIVPQRFDQSLLWVGLTSGLVGLMLANAARQPAPQMSGWRSVDPMSPSTGARNGPPAAPGVAPASEATQSPQEG